MPKTIEESWPASKVALWPITKIKPYETNPRLHSDRQIELIALSMKDDGVTSPILVDEAGVIIYGHGRRLAALKNGYTRYPVAVALGWSETKKQAVRIKDNSYAALSDWDRDLLQGELSLIHAAGYDMPLLGFSDTELLGWGVGEAPPQDPEQTPPAPKNPIVRAGDVWDLDGHRLAVGDATQAQTWHRLFGDHRASMVFTDPPYGVSYDASRRHGSKKYDIIKGDQKRGDDLFKMLVAALRQTAEHSTAQAGMYIWHSSSCREDFAEAMKAAGIMEKQYLMWVKPGIVISDSDYSWQQEPCFYASKAGHNPRFYGEKGVSTVWHVAMASTADVAVTVGNGILILDGKGSTLYVQSRSPKNRKLRQVRIADNRPVLLTGSDRQDGTIWEVARDAGGQHPTQKPVELARRAINNSSLHGEIVADAFLGSGTTMIGAEMTGRRAYGIEIDPAYAEVAITRWQAFTGRNATLDGKTFAEVERKRKRGRPRPPAPSSTDPAPA